MLRFCAPLPVVVNFGSVGYDSAATQWRNLQMEFWGTQRRVQKAWLGATSGVPERGVWEGIVQGLVPPQKKMSYLKCFALVDSRRYFF